MLRSRVPGAVLAANILRSRQGYMPIVSRSCSTGLLACSKVAPSAQALQQLAKYSSAATATQPVSSPSNTVPPAAPASPAQVPTQQQQKLEQQQQPTQSPQQPAQTPEPEQPKGWWAKAKALAKFYFSGVKQIYYNWKQARQLKARLQSSPDQPWSRAEFQLVQTSKKDVRKAFPFILLVELLPEAIPLIVLYFPRFIPSTCVMQSQLEKMWSKQLKQRDHFSYLVMESLAAKASVVPKDFTNPQKLQQLSERMKEHAHWSSLNRSMLSSVCKFYGLSGLGLPSTLRKRLDAHFAYLREDDVHLAREEGGYDAALDALDATKLRLAAEERGISSSIMESDAQIKLAIKERKLTATHLPDVLLAFAQMSKHYSSRPPPS